MSTLVDKIRKLRESTVDVGKFKFIIRRPTDSEALSMRHLPMKDIVDQFVVGWQNVQEIDVIPGGNPTDVAFDKELWAEWSSDRPDFWQPITTAVTDAYLRHRSAKEEAEKN